MVEQCVQLRQAWRYALTGSLADDFVALLSGELIGHFTPQSVQRVSCLCLGLVRGRQVCAIQHSYFTQA